MERLYLALLVLLSCQSVWGKYHILDETADLISENIRRNRRQVSNESVSLSTTELTTTTPASTTTTTATTTTTTTRKTTAKTLTTERDEHAFYATQLFDDFDRYWIELYYGSIPSEAPNNISNILALSHDKLSISYRTAAVVDLKFTFPFYGHPVKRVVIATGGFIYVGEMLNPRLLTFSQFVAPLMANFDFSVSNSDRLLYFMNESMLVVEWRDVVLQESPSKPFRFQTHIHRDGRIVFAYKDVPVSVDRISQSKHPVEVSLSDAYIAERTQSATGISIQTMHVYSETKIPSHWVKSRSVVKISPLPTCVQMTSCSLCLTPAEGLAFKCAWCPSLRRCSYGFDRFRKAWMDDQCHLRNVSQILICDTLLPEQREGTSLFSKLDNSKGNTGKLRGSSSTPVVGAWAVLIGLIVVAIVAAIVLCVGWIVYAHYRPGSRAGIWLIEHRPARLLADTGNFFRRTFASARSFFSSSKPTPTETGHSSGQRQNPIVAYRGSNGRSHNSYDVSVDGITLSASRI